MSRLAHPSYTTQTCYSPQGRRTGLVIAFTVVFVGVDKVYIFRFTPFERVPFGSSILYASMGLQKKSRLPTAELHWREKVFKYKINSLNKRAS